MRAGEVNPRPIPVYVDEALVGYYYVYGEHYRAFSILSGTRVFSSAEAALLWVQLSAQGEFSWSGR